MGYSVVFSKELYHHGIKGQKWGVRNGVLEMARRIQ